MKKFVFKLIMSLRKRLLVFRKDVSIGAYTYGIPKVFAHSGKSLTIGKFSSIADNVTIFLGNEHRVDFVSMYPFNVLHRQHRELSGHPKSKGDVVIGNDVWLGYGATILSGVSVGDGAVVAAHSVVAKSIPPYAVCAGNPARVIKYRFEENDIKFLQELSWWNFEKKKLDACAYLLMSSDIDELRNFFSKAD